MFLGTCQTEPTQIPLTATNKWKCWTKYAKITYQNIAELKRQEGSSAGARTKKALEPSRRLWKLELGVPWQVEVPGDQSPWGCVCLGTPVGEGGRQDGVKADRECELSCFPTQSSAAPTRRFGAVKSPVKKPDLELHSKVILYDLSPKGDLEGGQVLEILTWVLSACSQQPPVSEE